MLANPGNVGKDGKPRKTAKELAQEKQQAEKNALKIKLQNYQDIWEYKKVRWGPFWYTKKVQKPTVANTLKDERAGGMALDPDADEIEDLILDEGDQPKDRPASAKSDYEQDNDDPFKQQAEKKDEAAPSAKIDEI
eukprot:CAMPEP_0169478536 /NCGR_PEP_ID=MMETSP1042-20121227/28521_1 /TAXON_ID=464988 /ORGANISM="Hemiselmis andersenii, Strain CCMP1180" /LENGTH=135 /DNA_ID=CAMNT_0009592997 /DNA_START=188 /DNA_END=592 /DNA_ORIENTATION=-